MNPQSVPLDAFERMAQNYLATLRLSHSCAESIADTIIEVIEPDRPSPLLDIGCGDAYLSSLLLSALAPMRCILLDISATMLNRAKKRLSATSASNRAWFIRADARVLPMPATATPVALMAFVLHLLDNPMVALGEIKRVLRPEGRLFLLTYDPNDMSSLIYSKYFPGYRALLSKQFPPLSRLLQLLQRCGFGSVAVSKHPFQIRFKSVDDVLETIRDRPSSAFTMYSDDTFAKGLKEFEANMRRRFGEKEVIYGSEVSLLSVTLSE